MYRKPSLFVLCSLLLLLSACVSKSKYVQLEAEHADAKHKLKYTETRLGYTDESREKCMDSLADCQGRFKEKKLQLSEEMEGLQVSLEESQSTIDKQKKVIRDLHATRTKIESSLKKQIENQEIKLEEIEGKLKVTLVDKILFDTGKVEIAKRGTPSDWG
jgi:chemotaxis protein MotB